MLDRRMLYCQMSALAQAWACCSFSLFLSVQISGVYQAIGIKQEASALAYASSENVDTVCRQKT